MMNFLTTSQLMAGAIYLSTCLAQSDTNNTGSDCSSSEFKNGFNASGSITTPGFRVNDSYIASNWTWSRYIVDADEGNNKSSIWQTIGLKTDPLLNLSDPSYPYTGCVIVPLDIEQSDTQAEKDDGTCSSVFHSDCLKAIQDSIKQQASYLSGTEAGSSSNSCSGFLQDITGKNSKCSGVISSFFASSFLPRNFSEPVTPSSLSGCEQSNPGDSNSTSGSLFSWSDSVPTAKDNFTDYDTAIRFPLPVFVAVWLKDTSNGSSVYDTGNPPWSDTRVMCVPGNITEPGSRNITDADAAANGGSKIKSGLLTLVGVSIFMALLF